jgi:DNA-binding NarL/FixJ family response regulator
VKEAAEAYTDGVMKTSKIRILLADDNPALRSALALQLETRLNARIVGECDSMENLLSSLQLSQPDIIILDWELPGNPKADRIAILHDAYPSLKVVIIGSQSEISQQFLDVHADAYINRSEPPERMVQVLQEAAR